MASLQFLPFVLPWIYQANEGTLIRVSYTYRAWQPRMFVNQKWQPSNAMLPKKNVNILKSNNSSKEEIC